MECPFIDAISIDIIAHTLCEYLPHSMHATCKISNFLKTRIVCRSAILPISRQIGHRTKNYLLGHAHPPVRDWARKIKDSGILHQWYLPGLRRLRCLVVVERANIPWGMSQEYWDNRQRQNIRTGWINGKLEL